MIQKVLTLKRHILNKFYKKRRKRYIHPNMVPRV